MDEDEHSAAMKAKGGYDLESPTTQTYYDLPTVPLANSYPAPLEVDGRQYPTAEHYRQFHRFAPDGAAATETNEEATKLADLILASPTDKLTFLCSGKDQLENGGWLADADDLQTKTTRHAVRAKFEQHPALREQLLSTRDKTLVCLGDNLWGGVTMRSGMPEGKNNFGKILMEIRAELQAVGGGGTGGEASAAAAE